MDACYRRLDLLREDRADSFLAMRPDRNAPRERLFRSIAGEASVTDGVTVLFHRRAPPGERQQAERFDRFATRAFFVPVRSGLVT